MTNNEKPVIAATNIRASQNKHLRLNSNLEYNRFQCPCCKFTGSSKLFEIGWLDKLAILADKHSANGAIHDLEEMDINDRYGLYLHLSHL